MPEPRRLGVIDQVALAALKIMLAAVDEDDDFQDLVEEGVVETDSIAATLAGNNDEASMDAFYQRMDPFLDKVMARSGTAMMNLFRDPKTGDRVATEYTRWLQERPMQT